MIIGASGGSPIIFIILIAFGVIYVLFVRPRNKARLQQQQAANELRIGDEVLTVGGIYGTVSEIDEDQVVVQIAPETEVRVARRAIAGVTRNEEEDDEGAAEEEDAAEPEEPAETVEPEHDEGSGGDTSNEENRG
jgi:preprotein translocase subunit YajC